MLQILELMGIEYVFTFHRVKGYKEFVFIRAAVCPRQTLKLFCQIVTPPKCAARSGVKLAHQTESIAWSGQFHSESHRIQKKSLREKEYLRESDQKGVLLSTLLYGKLFC